MFASAVFNSKNEDGLRVTDFLANTNPRSSFGKFMHPTSICIGYLPLYGSGAGLYSEPAAQQKAPTKDSCEDWKYFLRSWCSTFPCTIKRLSVCQTQLPLLTGKRTLYVDIVDIMRYLYTPAMLTRRPIPLFLVFLLHLVFLFIPYPLFPLHRLLQNL